MKRHEAIQMCEAHKYVFASSFQEDWRIRDGRRQPGRAVSNCSVLGLSRDREV